jgi:hypothetical protein
MSGPPQGQPEYGYGGQPPYGPPPQPNKKNVMIAIAGVVVVAAAAIIAIVALSGGDDKKPTAASSTASAIASGTPSTSPAATASSSPASSSAASGNPAGALTCARIETDPTFKNKLTLHDGGTKPTGVLVPSADPAVTCTGLTQGAPSTPVTALAWNDVPLSDYLAQLTAKGWQDAPQSPYHVLSNGSSKYVIIAVTIAGNLVAVYGHS